jgi:hypothetical protein
MSASIRGHQGQIKFFADGAAQKIVDITSVEINQKSTFMQTNYVGKAVPEGDQTFEGFEGSCECEVKDAELDKFIDALVTANLAGIGVSDYTFVTTENYPDGSTQSYVYFDCQFKVSRRQAGLNEKITKRLEFQASGRLAL